MFSKTYYEKFRNMYAFCCVLYQFIYNTNGRFFVQPDEDGEIDKKIRKTIELLCKRIYNTVTKTIKEFEFD